MKHIPGMDDTGFRNGGSDIAGLMTIPHPDILRTGGTYFTANDTDETAKTAKELGGTIFVPPMNIPEIGRFCGIISPQGVRFYAIKDLPRQGS